MTASAPVVRQTRARTRILDAASKLFVEFGYAATSTRDIAQAVGIQQPSLYYHFAGKKQILTELLISTLGPSAQRAKELAEDPDRSAFARLEELVRFDVELLCSVPNNLGILYLLPEVNTDDYADSRVARDELRAAYCSFAEEAARASGRSVAPPEAMGELVYFLVESVILRRAAGGELPPEATASQVAHIVARMF
jgi:AcrR family transcriptional regulator